MRNVSLKSIAEAAQVSISTVSRVINNAAGISEQTRNHVLEIMQSLNYHPRQFTAGQSLRPSRMISLVITEKPENIVENPFFIMAVKGATAAAREFHYHVSIEFCRDVTETLEYVRRVVDGNWTDGVVLFSVQHNDPCIAFLRDSEFPFSVIGRPDLPVESLWVDNDNFQAMYSVVSELIDQGHFRISFVGAAWPQNYTIDRYEGYRQAMKSRGFEPDGELVPTNSATVDGHSTEDIGYETMQALLLEAIPDAVVAADDFLAFGVLRALGDRELTDVAVVGFNNSIRGLYQSPSLSSVDIHPEALGYHAARILIDYLQDGKQKITHQIVETTIVHRETTLTHQRS